MIRLITAIATGLYVGYLPKAPGSFGTLLAIPLHMLFTRFPLPYYWLALFATLVIGVLCAGSMEKLLDLRDPGVVVIDEVLGMLITLIGAPDNPWVWGIGFVLFRFFDIVKPYPIGLVDQRFHGGLGIMLDDIIAGLYSLAALQLICHFWFKG